MAAGHRKRVKLNKSDAISSSAAVDDEIPALPEIEPAKGSFLISAGTYERILYGIEGRFVGEHLTLNPQFIFPAHIGCIKAVSVGGRYLASGSTDEIIKLYDLKKRVELGSLHEHKGSITSLCFHGHTHLLSASEDGAICIFRTKDWEPLKVLKGHTGPVNAIAIHPTGKLALSVSQDRTVIVWNLLTGQRASRTKTPQAGEIVAWNSSGALYVIAYATEIQVHRVGQAEPISTIFSRQRILATLVVSFEECDYVLAGCQDKRIRIYSIEGTELAAIQCHENRIKGLSSVDMTFPDGSVQTIVVSISSDGHIKAWSLASMLAPVSKSDNSAASAKDGLDLAIEPLAVYNADVRLTCVSTSNNTFT
ncbi:60s ribosome biogenesis protein mak11 [Coemansia spiralis]|uniref:60s ribosome biogenesis protein mak11 n=2 Tax=Coemansia TaxID=4863 RepID=A0A9W8GAN7_9FUNG|nr:WD40-repeat-containing domain protein [Coemansia spiralis]KAJ1995065.1 60s ribosome biogenesis protein mak11 [Coemansia umbellata]KAJ2623995.1 60s ribosome biogenesis protein mak11 [Coemansia sp. RSA 1358]KAJ2679604.1 60s ribosome biogenesis protein mak11 [Coemansia spiralis]